MTNLPEQTTITLPDFRLGECLVQPQLNRITRNGETLQIEPKIMRVLVYLAEHAEQVVTREQLLEAVWGDVFVSEQVLSRSISELRKFLADDSKTQSIIETIPKTGYRLATPVVYETGKTNGEVKARVASESLPAAPERGPTLLEAIALTSAAAPAGAGRGVVAGALVLCAAAILLAAWSWLRPSSGGPDAVLRLSLELAETVPPELDLFQTLALAPDGRRLVYSGKRAGKYQLFLRAFDQPESTPLTGTENGVGPFFSPDGQWVGFYSDGTLKKVSLAGGQPVVIGGQADDAQGASWGEDGTIIYTRRFFEGLWRISAAGGQAEVLTQLDRTRGERSHLWPEILPGGEAVLFTIWYGGDIEDAQLSVLSLKTGEKRILGKGAGQAHYLPTGHLAYVGQNSLRVVPFDLRRLTTDGPSVVLPEGVAFNPISGAAHFVCSRTGMLVYLPKHTQNADHQLVWVDRRGQAQPLLEKTAGFVTPRLSLDGTRLAVTMPGRTAELWVYELAGGAFKRLTFEKVNLAPVWTPDSRRIIFSSDAGGAPLNLYWKAADGSGAVERLTQSNNLQFAGGCTPDGRLLVFAEVDPETRWDIWMLDLNTPERRPQPLLKTKLDEAQPALSPDGRWLAYTAKEHGQWQIYVQPFPSLDGKWQVSTEGGQQPIWSRTGKELYYRTGDRVMMVALDTFTGFKAAQPQPLFTGDFRQEPITLLPSYDVAPDGQRFVMVRGGQESGATRLNVVLGWFADLQSRLP
jgi:DNA-binding winged helix-turn-helix (wHTH) protein/Tol biopolymer transport system component